MTRISLGYPFWHGEGGKYESERKSHDITTLLLSYAILTEVWLEEVSRVATLGVHDTKRGVYGASVCNVRSNVSLRLLEKFSMGDPGTFWLISP